MSLAFFSDSLSHMLRAPGFCFQAASRLDGDSHLFEALLFVVFRGDDVNADSPLTFKAVLGEPQHDDSPKFPAVFEWLGIFSLFSEFMILAPFAPPLDSIIGLQNARLRHYATIPPNPQYF